MTAAAKIPEFKCHYNKDNQTLNGVPLWMLFIDKDCFSEPNPAMFFDVSGKQVNAKGEPGYNKAMTAAFDYVLTHLNKKLDAEEFKQIHHLCVASVKNINSDSREFYVGVYRINLRQVTDEAKEEWIKEGIIENPEDLLKYEKKPENFLATIAYGKIFSKIMDWELRDITQKANDFFKEYYEKLNAAKNADDKLLQIVTLCQKLEISHFFIDGNQRAIAFVLLNKLLIENGLAPTILDDPIVFDGYLSRNQLVEAVKKGQAYFLEQSHKLSIENNATAQTDQAIDTTPPAASTSRKFS